MTRQPPSLHSHYLQDPVQQVVLSVYASFIRADSSEATREPLRASVCMSGGGGGVMIMSPLSYLIGDVDRAHQSRNVGSGVHPTNANGAPCVRWGTIPLSWGWCRPITLSVPPPDNNPQVTRQPPLHTGHSAHACVLATGAV